MPIIETLGSANKKTKFSYDGNVNDGVLLNMTGRPRISSQFFHAILNEFRGRRISGGFSETNPTPGGLGEWVKDNSPHLNPVHLSPRHASFISAILVSEDFIESELEENKTVYLQF